MGSRLLLQPPTVSILFLAIVLYFIVREETRIPGANGPWPDWRLVVLFAIWANVDGRFVLGLGAVALFWLGRVCDAPQDGVRAGLRRWAVTVGVLVVASCFSPSHVNGLRWPPELRTAAVELWKRTGEARAVNSAFDRAYLDAFRDSPAALSYYPLLALGLLSFLLNRRGWRWARFLPWVAFAVASGIQVRLVPFFAIVAGPVAAWNLQEFFARRASAPVRRGVRYVGFGSASVLALAFLVCAWPGWLQGPPFEPRQWVVEPPPSLSQGADFLRRAHAGGLWPAETGTLHVSPDTAAAFAWYCPEDRVVRDEAAVGHLLNFEDIDNARQRLRALGVTRVVVHAADPSAPSDQMLDRLLVDPGEWPVLHLTGGLVVFGWRDPGRRGATDPYADWEVDFARLAFRPTASEVAPPSRPLKGQRWWDAFWKPAPPPRPPGRDEAAVLLRKAAAEVRLAPRRHVAAWEASQAVGLVGAASGWSDPVDAALRLTLFQPPIPQNAPLPAITRLTFVFQQQFALDRGHAPVGILYAAIRAARRAVAENAADANAHLALGRAYLALLDSTAEQSWANRVPQLLKIRQLQASAALNRAVALNPRLAQAHLELGRLYLTLSCADLAAAHLRTFRNTPVLWGGPKPGDRATESLDAEIARLTKALEHERGEFSKESAKSSVSDRAEMAARRGLGGAARDLLLKSDVAAFGAVGMELELDLLLRTGRPDDVLEWVTSEARGSLSDFTYHSLRAQAFIAAGEYANADAELTAMIGPGGQLPSTSQVGKEVAGLVGKTLLDEQPAGFILPQLPWRTLGRPEFENRIAERSRKLARSADILMLRGLVALEAGNIDRARESLHAALAFSPNRWGGGQLAFNGQTVARDCLGLIDP
ncbi:hypothetical protein J8F10_05935 [Gemmata sp. G18]|uniref:Tetratricopeptide repeat protein n=1 Tax=Gemmata palustris TaxID=2822762 RepID=A0ABS5BMA1_9BACT|nr:hypothetical protein [Gemmata palustris]MBP3954821.1 hypothetical protein [Gemmata palustris]